MTQDTQINPQAEVSDINQIPQPSARRVKALLTVVIVLGVLLLVGLAVVVGTIIKRLNNPDAVPESRVKKGFGVVESLVPAGTRIISTQTTADKLVIQLSGPDGESLMIYDVRKGIELGRIKIAIEQD
ncbi:MAG: hypothetical protein ACON41_03605 [Parvibaculales bacterium]